MMRNNLIGMSIYTSPLQDLNGGKHSLHQIGEMIIQDLFPRIVVFTKYLIMPLERTYVDSQHHMSKSVSSYIVH